MNSEILQDIARAQSPQQEKIINAEQSILQKASLLDDFKNHEGWQIVVKQLEAIKQKSISELLNVTVCDNLSKIQARRILINAIDLFITSPDKFVNQRNMILSRRNKNVTK